MIILGKLLLCHIIDNCEPPCTHLVVSLQEAKCASFAYPIRLSLDIPYYCLMTLLPSEDYLEAFYAILAIALNKAHMCSCLTLFTYACMATYNIKCITTLSYNEFEFEN